MTPPTHTPHVAGWRERVDLPDWGVARLLAKADTGARSSAVHAENIEHVGTQRVAFDVVYSRKHPEHRERVVCPIARSATIRSSNGELDERIIVETTLRLGPVRKTIEVTLVSRELMQCRMLIGRSALEPEFLVDPGRTYLLSHPPKRARSPRA
ncbi:MAG: ATP-dependent zinc protease [Phycisphaerales bacterium JB040]